MSISKNYHCPHHGFQAQKIANVVYLKRNMDLSLDSFPYFREELLERFQQLLYTVSSVSWCGTFQLKEGRTLRQALEFLEVFNASSEPRNGRPKPEEFLEKTPVLRMQFKVDTTSGKLLWNLIHLARNQDVNFNSKTVLA